MTKSFKRFAFYGLKMTGFLLAACLIYSICKNDNTGMMLFTLLEMMGIFVLMIFDKIF